MWYAVVSCPGKSLQCDNFKFVLFSYLIPVWPLVDFAALQHLFFSFVAADQTRAMQDQFTGNAAAMSQQDPNKAFKVYITWCIYGSVMTAFWWSHFQLKDA